MTYTREQVDSAIALCLQHDSEEDVTILVAHIDELRAIVEAIDELQIGDEASLTIYASPEQSSHIEIKHRATDWKAEQFTGDNLADCLHQAVAAKRAAES